VKLAYPQLLLCRSLYIEAKYNSSIEGYVEANLVQDFVKDSAEMNTIQPEDLDEEGKCSSKAISFTIFLLLKLIICLY
jgi:hypothetical protein